MRQELLTCFRCGHEGHDVHPALIDLEAEAKAEGTTVRIVDVELVTPLRHVDERTTHTVPERYATEWRCQDKDACDVRFRALTPAEPAPAAPVEEAVPWL